tara:strand:- start:1445 stop:1957 length:513 start_codon:yes stop_codon:yes gene_type:complete
MNEKPHKKVFPVELLRVKDGSLRFAHGSWHLTLELEKFDLPNCFENEFAEVYQAIETNIRIEFSDPSPEQMAGRIIQFDLPNEELEGSMYLGHAHHPIDIFELDASTLDAPPSKPCSISFKAKIVLTHEGLDYGPGVEYDDCLIAYKLQLTPEGEGWLIGPADPMPLAGS